MSTMFRRDQRKLSQGETETVHGIRELAQELYDRTDMIGPSRETDLANARLEERVMWAVKPVSDQR
jgi:hypothetical protein